MTEEQQKEQFCVAYVRAVAAVAGVKVERPEMDDDSIDLRFSVRSIAGSTIPPIIETQLKCTSEPVLKPDGLHFELKLKNYQDLRIVPRFLIVLLVPPAISDWLGQTSDELVLKKCAYWCSLKDHPATTKKSSVTVIDGQPRKVAISLPEAEHKKAIQAYEQRTEIRCRGVLTKSGQLWSLQESGRITMLADE